MNVVPRAGGDRVIAAPAIMPFDHKVTACFVSSRLWRPTVPDHRKRGI
jgi:hypothetical protein